jgi:AcrR family transcriptional regulator
MKNISASPESKRKQGRPLSFDRDKALRAAMLLFWRHGYESTSLSELTAAMGITPPSLYAAFGDKKNLFRETVKLYLSGPQAVEEFIAQAPTARAAAEQLLSGSAILFTGADTPRGCLVASATASCSSASADLQRELAQVRTSTWMALKARIELAIRQGQMPAGADAEAMASHVVAVIQGMSTLARDGMSRAGLLKMARAALAGWP